MALGPLDASESYGWGWELGLQQVSQVPGVGEPCGGHMASS